MKLRHLLFFCVTCVLASCALDHQFLKPDKVPAGKKQAYSRDGKGDTLMVAHFDSHHQPAFTTAANKPIDLGYTIESVVLDNKDKSHKITGWFMKPVNAKADITLLFLHGNAGNVITEYSSGAELVKRGMQVFIIDYSGYGFSEGKATWKNVWNDAGTALQYLRTRPDVQGTLLGIYGQSYGGYTAIPLAQKYESLIDGVVAEGAPSSRKDIGAHQSGLGIIARILIKDKHSPKKAIRKYHKPVLIIQSDEDGIVPYRMAETLYSKANEPKTLYKIHQRHICGLVYYPDSIAYYVRKTIKR